MIQQLLKSWWWNKLIRVVFTVSLFLFVKSSNAQVALTDVIIPSGSFDMGDHFGFVDPNHPSDETPIHSVELDSFYISNIEISNAEYLLF